MSQTPGQQIVSKPSEADACRKYVTPQLVAAGWDSEPHSLAEQRTFTAGRIIVAGTRAKRQEAKRADYLLRYTPDFTIAVVEAKPEDAFPGDGLQQAKDYAEILGLKFAYSTNGPGIIEFDFLTGVERELGQYPTPDELWSRLSDGEGLSPEQGTCLLTPTNTYAKKPPRYYQEIAINRVVKSILQGQRRNLLTMATGTGKTSVAFQVCWKLWSSGWNRDGRFGKPRILFLADRNILVDDPKDKDFLPFREARWKIEGGMANKSRQMYFALYQSLAKDENRPGLYREFGPDFFDLIVIDECHRGSAADDSNWREILEYFEPAFQLGMTATPLRTDNKDTYEYFGAPLYTYSLRQGIEDGFLAPYRVHRILTTVDAAGWRPQAGQVDECGNEIPDQLYTTPNFERDVVLRQRTDAIAKHITTFLNDDPYAKTIVFCVDQEHAENMRAALTKCNPDLTKKHPDYVCRIVSDEGDVGKGHLGRFKDVETVSPVIVTTSQMLTTGVDVPTCRNIAIVRNIGSMTEFKQIIGRGTRVRDDYNKLYFNILDYTGSATRLFADPDFDGDPVFVKKVAIDAEGEVTEEITETTTEQDPGEAIFITNAFDPKNDSDGHKNIVDGTAEGPKKYYVDGGNIEVTANVVWDLDADGKRLRMVKLTEYAGEKVKTLWRSPEELRDAWVDLERRREIVDELARRGIDFESLADAAKLPETILDPACGTGGFLVEAFSHLSKQAKTVQHRRVLLEESIFGGEAKPLPFLLAQMNLLLHGVESPQIDPRNSLITPLRDIGDKDRVDIILTNPPFGGEEEKGIQGNFPEDKQTAETALLFLMLIMRKLRRTPKPGRAGVVVPNGTLFGDGVCARIKEELLKDFNLHTIVRLPNGVFAPYTSIPANLLFFDRTGPTEATWYYELPPPEGRKNYTKTQPLQYEEFADCIGWWRKRTETDRAWKVPVEHVLKYGSEGRLASVNLDVKNPNGKADFEHLPPAQLVDDIIAKERKILEILAEIKVELGSPQCE